MSRHQKDSMEARTAELLARKAAVEVGGGENRQKKQHEQGKLTARERIAALLDPGTFQETGMFAEHQSTYFGLDRADLPADGVVTGEGPCSAVRSTSPARTSRWPAAAPGRSTRTRSRR